jgi:hypothetical protein
LGEVEARTLTVNQSPFSKAMVSGQIETITAEVIDDHLGFIARGADDLTNLEPVLTRLEKAAHTADAVTEQMIEEIFCETEIRLKTSSPALGSQQQLAQPAR